MGPDIARLCDSLLRSRPFWVILREDPIDHWSWSLSAENLAWNLHQLFSVHFSLPMSLQALSLIWRACLWLLSLPLPKDPFEMLIYLGLCLFEFHFSTILVVLLANCSPSSFFCPFLTIFFSLASCNSSSLIFHYSHLAHVPSRFIAFHASQSLIYACVHAHYVPFASPM
jgi:hypothetical protein